VFGQFKVAGNKVPDFLFLRHTGDYLTLSDYIGIGVAVRALQKSQTYLGVLPYLVHLCGCARGSYVDREVIGNDRADGHGATGNGQNKNTVHGSILRIDPLDPATTTSPDTVSVNGKYRVPADNPFVGVDGVDEIYAYGFRNPWRFSFDSLTGDLVAADVGQGQIEEIDIVHVGGNYGWNLKEGTFSFDPETGTVNDGANRLPEGLIDPVAQYDHDEGISITGGFVYRGSAIPDLRGKYVFGDFSSGFFQADGRLLYADLATGLIQEFIIGLDDRNLGLYVKAFGQDAYGELYLLAGGALGPYGDIGVILKIVPAQTEFSAELIPD